jgi:hypothetical protein
MDPRARHAIIDHRDRPDMRDSTLPKEPTERIDPAEPMLPMLSTEPTDPMDSREFVDPTLKVEFRER